MSDNKLEKKKKELAEYYPSNLIPENRDHDDGGDWSWTQMEKAFEDGFDAAISELISISIDFDGDKLIRYAKAILPTDPNHVFESDRVIEQLIELNEQRKLREGIYFGLLEECEKKLRSYDVGLHYEMYGTNQKYTPSNFITRIKTIIEEKK